MNASRTPDDWPEIYRQYCHNFCRHLNDIARTFEQRLMAVMARRGYPDLRMTWVQVIPFLGPQGERIVDLAREQGISKQAMGQLVSEIEAQGYLLRSSDTRDQRTRRVMLSAKGLEMVTEAARAAALVERDFENLVGPETLQALRGQLKTLFHHFKLHYPAVDRFPDLRQQPATLPVHLFSLATLFEQRLMEADIARGHRGLKRSFGLILPFLGESGARIVDIARIQGVSKQAISQIAQSVEKAGYIRRQDDPEDRRSRRLVLTPRGRALIRDSVLAMQSFETELGNAGEFAALKTNLALLHARLGIPHPEVPVALESPASLLQAWLAALASLPQAREFFTETRHGLVLNTHALQQLQHAALPAHGSPAAIDLLLRALQDTR